MKIAFSTAVLASLVAPAFSLSYLESLNPVGVAPKGGSVANGASYLAALSVSSAPTGAGMTSYLDALPKNSVPSMAGSGMASYVDALGAGKAPAAYAPAPAAPAAPAKVESSAPSGPAASGGNYLQAISGASSSGAPTGAGMFGYLDALPRTSSAMGGAGIKSFTDALPVTNTVAGTGSGMNTYTDNLSGGKYTTSKSYSPFGSKPMAPSFVGSVGGSEIGFTLEASDLSSLVAQLRGSGGTIRLSGSITGISVV
mmetsp:Transcript_58461/g.163802  ORF Transcript_58461/g.163802 Transcript_58461/m.163802 type:complete len:255 (-) Transcript_58461:161-925(-)|eukprot:CAMPEP_0176183484 /NCGR_PEP_ID=MMETSP0121_2-20121125/314_1 /TAXON_ID=160619 /ORGANISM="Kryptoperidinium foliaceum, Strain CCMP 1326" /LENGTH=254 /DNA_ID=CAMNT_0017521811 /DNA_START=21 /DNA_END=785 /DNA_ORIENTATION=-